MTPRPPPPISSSSQSQKLSSKSLPIPTTGYQLKRDWSNLNNQIEEQSIYFNKIPPTSYKKIFSTGLDSSIFSRIIHIWSNKTDNDEHLINSMYELCQTPRFDTQLSFLSNNDKQLLKTILQRLSNQQSLSTEKISMILNNYKID